MSDLLQRIPAKAVYLGNGVLQESKTEVCRWLEKQLEDVEDTR